MNKSVFNASKTKVKNILLPLIVIFIGTVILPGVIGQKISLTITLSMIFGYLLTLVMLRVK